jgi:hypothetical protein
MTADLRVAVLDRQVLRGASRGVGQGRQRPRRRCSRGPACDTQLHRPPAWVLAALCGCSSSAAGAMGASAPLPRPQPRCRTAAREPRPHPAASHFLPPPPPPQAPPMTLEAPPHPDLRVSTITPASIQALAAAGAWPEVAPNSAEFLDMQVRGWQGGGRGRGRSRGRGRGRCRGGDKGATVGEVWGEWGVVEKQDPSEFKLAGARTHSVQKGRVLSWVWA